MGEKRQEARCLVGRACDVGGSELGWGSPQRAESALTFGEQGVIPSQALSVKTRICLGPSSAKIYSSVSCRSEFLILHRFLDPKSKVQKFSGTLEEVSEISMG